MSMCRSTEIGVDRRCISFEFSLKYDERISVRFSVNLGEHRDLKGFSVIDASSGGSHFDDQLLSYVNADFK